VSAAGSAVGSAGRIGPNAIIRVAEVLPSVLGEAGTQALFEAAGLAAYLRRPPQDMVDESEVARLHLVLRQQLGGAVAGQVAHRAGERTADYLLAHRIPKPVQALLKILPAPLAARVLLTAIRRNAWTFAGSGEFTAVAGQPCVLTIRHNPLCRGLVSEAPACEFYSATFERLFQVLVHPQSQAVETECEARGDPICRFELRW
jgi:divinyl protochlorophyllide a 8-vinyl-reductase